MDNKSSSTEIEDLDQRIDHVQELGTNYVPDTEEEKRLVRKIDLSLLPTIWLMYLLSYMDRTK